MIHVHINSNQGYYHIFDSNSGVAIRWGANDKDPFWREEGPELLDVAITNFCERECEFCYRKASKHGIFMEISLFEEVLRQAESAGVQQIALGGGNPNQHPDFIKFLKMANEHHIVPSYTTNGQGMTDEIYQATKKYGGAVAVSWYEPYTEAIDVIEKCGKYGITVNIHFVLHNESLQNAQALLRSDKVPWNYVNAIVFLNYKPLGFKVFNVLKDDEKTDEFLKSALSFEKCRIGFDSCMISWLMKYRDLIAEESIDYCEAGRFSAFISEKGGMYPCSFLCDSINCGCDIREERISKIWKSGKAFIKIREALANPAYQKSPIISCIKCSHYTVCHGGCQEFAINRCK